MNSTRILMGEFGTRSGDYNGFEHRYQKRWSHLTAVFGNLGFLYDLRTGVLHVRIMSSIAGKRAV